jgi:hypothetical protein
MFLEGQDTFSSLEAARLKCHKGPRGRSIFRVELPPSLSTPSPPSTFPRLRNMTSGRKRPLSPLATQGPNPQKIPRLDDRAGQRVAPTEDQPWVTAPQRVPGEGDGPAFIFGDIRGISVLSSA